MGQRRLKRGDVVVIADGKPRPAVVVQDDSFDTPIDVLVCPFTTTLLDAPLYRLEIFAADHNGLKVDSQLMVDKLGPARRDRISAVIGRLSEDDLARLNSVIAVMLGLGG